jgi:hypothetical protein
VRRVVREKAFIMRAKVEFVLVDMRSNHIISPCSNGRTSGDGLVPYRDQSVNKAAELVCLRFSLNSVSLAKAERQGA